MRSLNTKAHTFASRTSPSKDQSLQKSVLFANPKRNSFFSSLPSVFYFFATHSRHKNSWTETAKTYTGQGLKMTEDRRPACNRGLAKVAVRCSGDNDGSGWLIIRQGGFQIMFCAKNHCRQIAKLKIY